MARKPKTKRKAKAKPRKVTIVDGREQIGVLLKNPGKTIEKRMSQAKRARKRGEGVLLNPPTGAVRKMKGAELSPREIKAKRVVSPRPKRKVARRRKR